MILSFQCRRPALSSFLLKIFIRVEIGLPMLQVTPAVADCGYVYSSSSFFAASRSLMIVLGLG